MKKSVFIFSVITCITLLCGGCNNNNSGSVNRHEEFIDMGTHRIRSVISDLHSDYTIILEAGGGRFSDVYDGIQDTLAEITGCKVISYGLSTLPTPG